MRALTASAGASDYGFAATSDWDAMNDATLRDVRVVIWLNDMPHTPAQRAAFERYMTGGGAWLGFHVSGFGNNAWPWFTRVPRRRPLRRQQLAVAAGARQRRRRRASDVEGVPPTFVAPINEWYRGRPARAPIPDVKVLLTLDASNFPLGVKNTLNGGDIPVAWINTKYRMVYLNYGHGDRIYSTPDPADDDRQQPALAAPPPRR